MTDLFVYFAYGSNMLTRRLTNRVGGVTKVGVGYVPGRTLTFDKKILTGRANATALHPEMRIAFGASYFRFL